MNTSESATGGINESWFDHADAFLTHKVPSSISYEIADEPGTIQTLEGEVSYDTHFRIITGVRGERDPVPPNRFAELYDDQGDGTATPKRIQKRARLADQAGSVRTSWGETLNYSAGADYIVRHSEGDYGVIKADIFYKTYDVSQMQNNA